MRSLFKDIRDSYRRMSIIVRSHWNYWRESDHESDDEVSLPRNDDVLSAVAERHFALAYPDPAIDFSSDISSVLWINRTSALNKVLSFLSNLLRVSSIPLFFYFICLLLFGRLDLIVLDYGYGVGTLGTYLFDAIWAGTATCAAITSSLLLRELDKAVTMQYCLAAARDVLKDRQIYHQEKCLLTLEQINDKVEIELDKYRTIISAREAEIGTLEEMCAAVGRMPDLDKKSRKMDLANYRTSIKKLSNEVRDLRKDLGAVEKRAARSKAEIWKSFAMARLTKVVGTLLSIRNGDQVKQIEDLSENANSQLALIEDRASDLHENFLIETGVVGSDKESGPLLK